MFVKAVALLLAMALAVVSSARMAGAPVDANMDDEDVRSALQFAVSQHNKASNDMYVSQVARVIRVQKQVVSGLKYIFEIEMARTTCRKSGLDDLCPISDGAEAYGYVFMINRVEADPSEVLVDQWPDLNVLIIKPKLKKEADQFKDVCIFAKDDTSLQSILVGTDILNWKQYICLSLDLSQEETLQTVAKIRGVSKTNLTVCHMMTLKDPSQLKTDRQMNLSSLNDSHVALVNSTWKFAEENFSKRMISNMIKNFPSCCVLDEAGKPVAWILTYAYCAMGMLYTLPEHRRKGYAKTLIATLAKKLHSEGFPVYSFIEEENRASYTLYTNLGFTEDSSFRTAWYAFQ